MSISIFVGNPPQNICDWINEHRKPDSYDWDFDLSQARLTVRSPISLKDQNADFHQNENFRIYSITALNNNNIIFGSVPHSRAYIWNPQQNEIKSTSVTWEHQHV